MDSLFNFFGFGSTNTTNHNNTHTNQQVNDIDSPSANDERLDNNMDVDDSRNPAENPTTVNNTATNSSNNSNEGNVSNGLLGNNGHVGAPTAANIFYVNGGLPFDMGVSDANMNNNSAATMDDNATMTTASSAHISDVAFASKPPSRPSRRKPKTAATFSAKQQLSGSTKRNEKLMKEVKDAKAAEAKSANADAASAEVVPRAAATAKPNQQKKGTVHRGKGKQATKVSASTEKVPRVAAASKPNQQKRKRGAGIGALPTKSNKKQKQNEMSSTPNQQPTSQQQKKTEQGMVRLSLPTQSRTSINYKGAPCDRVALLKLGFRAITTLLRDNKLPMTKASKEDMVDRLLAGPPVYEKYTLAELKFKCRCFKLSIVGDESTLIARLKDHDNGKNKKPPSIKVMNPDDDQKQTIRNRIAIALAHLNIIRDDDTKDMNQEQKSRYVYPWKTVRIKTKHAGHPVGRWLCAWKSGKSCANESNMMDEFERNLLNEISFFSVPNGATREWAINNCTFSKMVVLYKDLVAVPRNEDESWDGVEEHDVVTESGVNLSEWGMLQRKLNKDGLLSAEQITCLNHIGFEFRIYKRKSHYELHSEHIKMWRLIQKYKDSMGSDFNGHISTCTGRETKLGQFIKNQRDAFNNIGRCMMFRIDMLKFLRLGIMADATSLGAANTLTDDRLMKGMVRNNNAERQRNQEVPTNHDDRLFKTAGDVDATKRAATPNSNNRVSLAATASSSVMMEEIEAQGGAADALGETEVAPEDDPIVNGMVDQALANIMASILALPPVGRHDEPTQDESVTYASQLETSNATDIFESQVGSTPTKMNTTSV